MTQSRLTDFDYVYSCSACCTQYKVEEVALQDSWRSTPNEQLHKSVQRVVVATCWTFLCSCSLRQLYISKSVSMDSFQLTWWVAELEWMGSQKRESCICVHLHLFASPVLYTLRFSSLLSLSALGSLFVVLHSSA